MHFTQSFGGAFAGAGLGIYTTVDGFGAYGTGLPDGDMVLRLMQLMEGLKGMVKRNGYG